LGAQAFAKAAALTRDHARTPFPWSAGPHSGFTTGTPWLMANPLNAPLHAAAQAKDAGSVLAFAKRLIALRRADPLWTEGAFHDLAPDDQDVFVFERTLNGRHGVVALNLRGHAVDVPALPEGDATLCNVASPVKGQLAAFECRVYAP
jgi:oligo-1,6-glucosidase